MANIWWLKYCCSCSFARLIQNCSKLFVSKFSNPKMSRIPALMNTQTIKKCTVIYGNNNHIIYMCICWSENYYHIAGIFHGGITVIMDLIRRFIIHTMQVHMHTHTWQIFTHSFRRCEKYKCTCYIVFHRYRPLYILHKEQDYRLNSYLVHISIPILR